MDALSKLGIDGWGLLLYLVNFGILFLLMKRFVLKPLLKMLDERKDRIKEDVDQATMMRKALEAERSTEEEERKARLLALDERIAEAKNVARGEAKRLVSEAEAQRDAILDHAAKTADATIASTVAESEKEIIERVKRVVTHVLEEGIPEQLVEESVKTSWEAVTKTA